MSTSGGARVARHRANSLRPRQHDGLPLPRYKGDGAVCLLLTRLRCKVLRSRRVGVAQHGVVRAVRTDRSYATGAAPGNIDSGHTTPPRSADKSLPSTAPRPALRIESSDLMETVDTDGGRADGGIEAVIVGYSSPQPYLHPISKVKCPHETRDRIRLSGRLVRVP